MERTKSKIEQVAPSLEQPMIDVMSKFGWSLHGRQEIQIQKGGESRIRGELSRDLYYPDSYTLVAESEKRLSHYVKLHFVRPIDFPNADKLDALENEYFSMKFTMRPPLALAFLPFLLGFFSLFVGEYGYMLVLFVVGGVLYYFMSNQIKQINVKNKEIEMKGAEILKKAELLLVGQ